MYELQVITICTTLFVICVKYYYVRDIGVIYVGTCDQMLRAFRVCIDVKCLWRTLARKNCYFERGLIF